MSKIISHNFEKTRNLGKKISEKLQGGEIFCLSGELGSGKTTFSQGLLEGLGAKGPYTSPTFLVMKEYNLKISNFKFQISNKNPKVKIRKVYHIDTYRVFAKDILDLGFEEIINNPKNVIIIEWPERIQKIVPKKAQWIYFKWKSENEREIVI